MISAERSQRRGRPLEPAVVVDPLDLLDGEEHRGQRRACCRSGPCGSCRGRCPDRATPGPTGPTPRCARCARSRGATPRPATARRRRPGTSAGRSSRRRSRSGRSAARRRPRWRRPRRARRRRRPRAGRSGIGTPVEVSLWVRRRRRCPRDATGLGVGAGRRLDDLGLVEVRRRGRGRGELRRELAEAQVLAAPLDQPEGGGVPERGRAAVAEQDLVAVGQREQLGQPVAQLADREAHRGLAVAGAQVGRRTPRSARSTASGRTFDGPAAEAAVAGQQVGGDGDVGERLGHRCNYRGRAHLRRIAFRVGTESVPNRRRIGADGRLGAGR